MKTKILKLSMLILLFGSIGVSCQKEEEFSDIVEGYIVGTFICDKIDGENGQATGNNTKRGFCILLKNSEKTNENWPMDFYSFDIPIDIFDFPNEILEPNHNSDNGGPNFFPDSFQYKYKFSFEYIKQTESNKVHFVCGSFAMMSPFPWNKFNQATLRNINLTNK